MVPGHLSHISLPPKGYTGSADCQHDELEALPVGTKYFVPERSTVPICARPKCRKKRSVASLCVSREPAMCMATEETLCLPMFSSVLNWWAIGRDTVI